MARTEISARCPTSDDVFFMDRGQKTEGSEKVSFSEKIVKNQVEVRGEWLDTHKIGELEWHVPNHHAPPNI